MEEANTQSEQFLYYKDEDFELYKGKMQDVLSTFEENSIDSIVCDPPYHLKSIQERFGKENSAEAKYGKDGSFQRLSRGFMGKTWDGGDTAFQPETWKHCFRVLKEGGYLLAFGGTRTFHRIACAIEDAGFEIRDTIMWLYGCLSNDTEILTSNGWKNSETITKNDFIYSLDLDKNIIIKNKVQNVFKYDYDGEMVSLKNQNTDQLLTPNHHCIVKDNVRTRIKNETKYYKNNDTWYYKDAWKIRSQSVTLPLASNYNGNIEIGNLFAELLGWIISEGAYHKDTNAISITQSDVNNEYVKRIRYVLGKLNIKYSEYSRKRTYNNREYIEHNFYIGKEETEIVNKIKELAPNKKLTWKLLDLSLSNKKFLLKGLCKGDGAKANNKFGFSAFYQKDLEQLDIFQALLHLTNKQGWVNKNKYCCSIHSNSTTEIQGKHYKDRFVKYDGKYVWCIETEIGNFVARRNGKIFITGNSGFPKSMNIGLAIDKKNGVDNRTGNIKKDGKATNSGSGCYNCNNGLDSSMKREYEERIAQNEWQGWGTCLKPAYEPIIVARKPFKGSLVDNVIANGVGGLNIDECRVDYNGEKPNVGGRAKHTRGDGYGFKALQENCVANVDGRFPANVITDGSEEVAQGMPNTKAKQTKGSDNRENKGNSMFIDGVHNELNSYNDEVSASRYFYCAKASKKDRDEGLDTFEEKYVLNTEINEEIKNTIKTLLNQ